MSIRFKCPNGHEMNVKDKYAGMAGLCPRCQARVLVPTPVNQLSDDAIVDMLGPPPLDDVDGLPVHQDPKHFQPKGGTDSSSTSQASLLGSSMLNRGMKICPKCKREVRAVYDICPHCRMYFTDLSEINRRMASTCKQCGTENEHHLIWCKDCGADLRLQR